MSKYAHLKKIKVMNYKLNPVYSLVIFKIPIKQKKNTLVQKKKIRLSREKEKGREDTHIN